MTEKNQRHIRISDVLVEVLRQLLHSDSPLYSAEISRKTGHLTASVFLVLSRLSAAGWVSHELERGSSRSLGRTPRRYYKLTQDGRRGAPAVLQVWATLGPQDAD